MAFILEDRVRESSIITGTGDIALAGAAGGYQRFADVMSVGDTTYYAIVAPGSAWESGLATYTGVNTLARTTVFSSSNGGAAVNFAAGSKDVFITQPAKKAQSFESGTVIAFQQSAAPLHWTKLTTHNDKALRVVSGAASSGGTTSFSAFSSQTVSVNNTTITQSSMASHGHSFNSMQPGGGGAGITTGGVALPIVDTGANTASTGGDGPHSHGITIAMAIQYVDMILAQKD
jgi:hypothetical protein